MKLNITLGNIIGIIISIFLIIGGLKGDLVLRGTNSSIALVVAGILFLIYDIVRLFTPTENEEEDIETEDDEMVDEGDAEMINEDDDESYLEEYNQDYPQDFSEDQTNQ